MRRFFFFGLLFASTAPQAQVYQRVDPITGQITYTNRPPPGIEVQADPLTVVRSPASVPQVRIDKSPPARRDPKQSSTSTPATFPRVDAAEQKRRDLDRHAILTEELQAEVKALKNLGKRPGNDQSARRHQANIASLKRELANLR